MSSELKKMGVFEVSKSNLMKLFLSNQNNVQFLHSNLKRSALSFNERITTTPGLGSLSLYLVSNTVKAF